MKKIELYVCEHCGTQYADKEACKTCESTHTPPKEIVSGKYLAYKNDHTGYPIVVRLMMADGKIVEYKR